MKKGHAESKLLFIGIVVTFLVIAAIVLNRINKKTIQPPVNQTQPEQQTAEEQTINEPEQAIDEGLYMELISPVDDSTVNNPSLNVTGKTEANAEVFINENELKADLSGNFSTTLTLEEGENIIVITAGDDEGNFAEKSLTIIYEPSE